MKKDLEEEYDIYYATLKVKIVELTYKYGIKPIARSFYLQPKTLREWRNLYEHYGVVGLATKRRKLDVELLEICLNKYKINT